MTSDSTRFRRSSSVLARRVGSEILITTPDREDCQVLSGTAGTIWLLLEEPSTVAELASEAGQIYRVAPEAVTSDIEGLLRVLHEGGFVERVGRAKDLRSSNA